MTISEYAKSIDVKNYTLKEALDKIGFDYKFDAEKNYFNNITCKACGQPVECSGFIGTESIVCNNCNKGLQDLTGIITKGSVGGMLDLDNVTDFENGKVWIVGGGDE